MPNYRRAKTPGGTYFFTVVTYKRQKILTNPECRTALRASINDVRIEHPFAIDAWVLLPDHIHCIWTLPDGDNDFSKRWGLIKTGFTKRIGNDLVGSAHPTGSRLNKREQSIWQRRFWEHKIRDENDLNNHINYIHYNPVKHGLVNYAKDWEYSTFHKYMAQGVYTADWGVKEEIKFNNDTFGE